MIKNNKPICSKDIASSNSSVNSSRSSSRASSPSSIETVENLLEESLRSMQQLVLEECWTHS